MIYKTRKKATEFRNQNGYSNLEPIDLESFLIKLNVITIFKPLSQDFSGMAIKSKDKNFMLINSNHSIGRQNFSICHELYHLYFDPNFTPHNSISGKFDKRTNEYLADIFASYLLMPDDAILNFIPDEELKKNKINLKTILKTEHYFKCSRTALLFRLKELNVITDSKFEEYRQDIKLKAKQNGYSTKLYEQGNENLVIGDFGSKSRYLFENEKISESHYLTLLNSIGIDLFND
ncbi:MULTISPECIES: ImmA/IrrE family metallo-endopeptidase [Flavobacteriaceae]|jgi:Zn-dependent peptidase ImmA (M78 family)|uniref:ImmA/IrrE family metallo-endopeptidase n=1 Tax=Flavobacteriaceae TaxID=49546 RepID=UPI000C3172CC|nr:MULTISPECIES: ImmA/IrrE family metallo-endopeptidase [Flavobacteriaceae]AUC84832.1 transcriptional regulator [Polaribacter sp. ALD11]TVZ47447.1 Zn-dependent peptidase ImmA (M78 family) [Olleya sp. Hel_I_94]